MVLPLRENDKFVGRWLDYRGNAPNPSFLVIYYTLFVKARLISGWEVMQMVDSLVIGRLSNLTENHVGDPWAGGSPRIAG